MKLISSNQAKTNFKNFLFKFFVFSCAFTTILIISTIILYITVNGLSAIPNLNTLPKNNSFTSNLIPILVDTVYVEVLTLLISIPISITAAIGLTQYIKNSKLHGFINFINKVLASFPSVLFGLFGYSFFCITLKLNYSILAGSLTVAAIILPNLITLIQEAILTIPKPIIAGAIALGANRRKLIFGTIIPYSLPGIFNAITLAAGKIIGESSALFLTLGCISGFSLNPISRLFSKGKTLTLHLYFLTQNRNLNQISASCFFIAMILLILVLILNFIAKILGKKFSKFKFQE